MSGPDRSRRSGAVALGAIGVAAAVSGIGVTSVVASPPSSDASQEAGPTAPSPAQAAAIAAFEAGDAVGVVDAEGRYRGAVDQRAVAERDERILDRLEGGFREPEAPYDPEYERLWEAMAVLDPVPVVDDAGTTVGWWIGRFAEVDELEAAQGPAEETVRTLLG